MTNRVNHQEIVKRLLDTKAVDFAAIGKTVGEIGPSMALADEPWEGFCGTMRTFIHLYIVRPGPLAVDNPDDAPTAPGIAGGIAG
jgi:hypothetical protein